MRTLINTYQHWFERRKQRRWRRLIEKHYLIAKTGKTIWAEVARVYEDKTSYQKIRLVYLQLHIDFMDGRKAVVISKALLHNRLSVEGKMIRFRFLQGDLSQIALCY